MSLEWQFLLEKFFLDANHSFIFLCLTPSRALHLMLFFATHQDFFKHINNFEFRSDPGEGWYAPVGPTLYSPVRREEQVHLWDLSAHPSPLHKLG